MWTSFRIIWHDDLFSGLLKPEDQKKGQSKANFLKSKHLPIPGKKQIDEAWPRFCVHVPYSESRPSIDTPPFCDIPASTAARPQCFKFARSSCQDLRLTTIFFLLGNSGSLCSWHLCSWKTSLSDYLNDNASRKKDIFLSLLFFEERKFFLRL
jgi:hypothetical protein